MINTFETFYKHFDYQKVDFQEFSDKVSILDISNKTSEYAVKNTVRGFIEENSSDYRLDNIDEFYKNLYEIVVENRRETLRIWFDRYLNIDNPQKYYQMNSTSKLLSGKVINGMSNSKYGRLIRNINFEKMYNTKKLYHDNIEYVYGLMEALFKDFKLRNSLVGPTFFEGILNKDIDGFWNAFMMTGNSPSVFNPYTFKFILENFYSGKRLFCPVLGWNSYQLAFHNTTWEEFIGTDVIPEVVENGNNIIFDEYFRTTESDFFTFKSQSVRNLLCPSEKLDDEWNFSSTYKEYFDAILFSPPYYKLEIYESDNQSIDSYPEYEEWLIKYWEKTIKICYNVLKPNSNFGFIIRDYVDQHQNPVDISDDMKQIALKYFNHIDDYQIKWGARKSARTPEKMRGGNYENFFLFKK